ncbi:MAG TPA: hypothetical protein VK609_10055 [Mucilaginibacter sp.]|nr:hypothetical protein [Mucilaginibacter sp.]
METVIDKVIIASDINNRDGVGVEIYKNGEMITEIFRDDTERSRTITLYKKEISLEVMEECIRVFRRDVPWDFIT